MKHVHLAAALVVSLASSAFANPSTRPANAAAPKTRVEQLIEQLGAEDFKARAAAAAQLRKIGRGALPALKNGTHDDAEIASWCAALAEQIDPTPRPELAQVLPGDSRIRVLHRGRIVLEVEQPIGIGNRAARAEIERMQRLLDVRRIQIADDARINVKKFAEIEGEMLELNRKLEKRLNLRLVEPAQPAVRDERKW